MSQLTAEELTALKSKAKDVRIDILKMITKANSGHTGGSLSAADILTLLFFHEMKVDPKIRRRLTVTVWSSPKAMQHRPSMPYWQKKDISPKKNWILFVRQVICCRGIRT